MTSSVTSKAKLRPFHVVAILGMFLPLVLAVAGVIPPSGDFFFSPWVVWTAAVLNAAFGVFYIVLIVRCGSGGSSSPS